jgi:rare lipoprotein A
MKRVSMMRWRLCNEALYGSVRRIVHQAAASSALALVFICAVPSRATPYPWAQADQLPVYGRANRVTNQQNREMNGVASWYGPEFAGKNTASGEVFNPEKLTAASRNLPIGSHVLVTNVGNARSVRVKINACGPFVKGRDIDVSRNAARRLTMMRKGVAPVRIKVLWIPPGAEKQISTRQDDARIHHADPTEHVHKY